MISFAALNYLSSIIGITTDNGLLSQFLSLQIASGFSSNHRLIKL